MNSKKMGFEIQLATGEVIDVKRNVMYSLEKCSQYMTLDELQQELRDLLSTQCTFYPGASNVSVWPWVVSVCHVYKQKGHILKNVEEVPSYIHVRHLKLEYLEGESLETLKKSITNEVKGIRLCRLSQF